MHLFHAFTILFTFFCIIILSFRRISFVITYAQNTGISCAATEIPDIQKEFLYHDFRTEKDSHIHSGYKSPLKIKCNSSPFRPLCYKMHRDDAFCITSRPLSRIFCDLRCASLTKNTLCENKGELLPSNQFK